jgi:hypothetical protein
MYSQFFTDKDDTGENGDQYHKEMGCGLARFGGIATQNAAKNWVTNLNHQKCGFIFKSKLGFDDQTSRLIPES